MDSLAYLHRIRREVPQDKWNDFHSYLIGALSIHVTNEDFCSAVDTAVECVNAEKEAARAN